MQATPDQRTADQLWTLLADCQRQAFSRTAFEKFVESGPAALGPENLKGARVTGRTGNDYRKQRRDAGRSRHFICDACRPQQCRRPVRELALSARPMALVSASDQLLEAGRAENPATDAARWLVRYLGPLDFVEAAERSNWVEGDELAIDVLVDSLHGLTVAEQLKFFVAY